MLAECLLEQGVDTVFGYPGGAVLDIYDALYMYSEQIRHIMTAHEQGAAHAADGYARATGKTGVVIATSGPGATNLVTGIASAYMDSSPIVAITGNVSRDLLGRDSFQEVNIKDIVKPVTKASFQVMRPQELAPTIRKAFLLRKQEERDRCWLIFQRILRRLKRNIKKKRRKNRSRRRCRQKKSWSRQHAWLKRHSAR